MLFSTKKVEIQAKREMSPALSIVSKVKNSIKTEGLSGTTKKAIIALRRLGSVEKEDPYRWIDSITNRPTTPFSIDDFLHYQDHPTLVLNWVMPDPGAGSGGHINIFRFASMLEERGFHSRFFCFNSGFEDNDALRSFASREFTELDEGIELFKLEDAMPFAHGTIATSWETAYVVKSFDNTIAKFYFIQDFEPFFFPMGTLYRLAELTYTFGFNAITAGYWLADLMKNKYGINAIGYGFSYNKKIYKAQNIDRKGSKRIFFYSRPITARREFELGLLVLVELQKKIPDLKITLAGGDLENYVIPLEHCDCLGIANPTELSSIYAQNDICLLFSDTNLSLLPLEIMASGSVVACNGGPNNSWVLNNENSIILDGSPSQMVDSLYSALNDPVKLNLLQKNGQEYAISTDWEKEGDKVASSVQTIIRLSTDEMLHSISNSDWPKNGD